MPYNPLLYKYTLYVFKSPRLCAGEATVPFVSRQARCCPRPMTPPQAGALVSCRWPSCWRRRAYSVPLGRGSGRSAGVGQHRRRRSRSRGNGRVSATPSTAGRRQCGRRGRCASCCGASAQGPREPDPSVWQRRRTGPAGSSRSAARRCHFAPGETHVLRWIAIGLEKVWL